MISLISRWKLRAGLTAELLTAIEATVDEVREHEPGTLMYTVHLPMRSPLGPGDRPVSPPPDPIPRSQQTEIVFFEVYRDGEAFAGHVSGEIFTRFRETTLHHFYEDPNRPGWPLTDTSFLHRHAGFIRPDAG